jgi:multiple sugar transport system substrate-binding protein
MRAARTLAVVSACLLPLAACSSGDTTAGGDAGGPVQLTLWTGFTGGDRAAYQGLVDAFNASHPDIKVSMQVQPWDTIAQQLPAAWGTGSGPDLATPSFDPNIVAKYVQNGSVAPLTPATGAGSGKINTDQLAPVATKAFTVDGTLYAVPANVATLQLYYNKKMFAAAGLAGPPETAEEFRADAVKLTSTSGGQTSQYGLSLADHETIQMWPILQWMDGGDIVGSDGCAVINSPASVTSLRTWADLVTQRGISPVGQSGAESDALFSAGKAAMQMNGPWAAAGYQKAGIDFGVAPIPVGSAGPVTLASTVPLMVAARSAHQDQARTLLAWWTSRQAQQQFAKASGFPPVRTDMADDPALAKDPVVSAFTAALPSARLYLGGVKNATQVDSDVYVPLIEKITRGADVASATSDAAGKINTLTGCHG